MVSKLSLWKKLLVAAVAVVVALAGVLFFVQRFKDKPSLDPVTASDLAQQVPSDGEVFVSESPAPSGIEAAEEITGEPDRKVSIYLDAWSFNSIKDETLFVVLPDGEITENLVFTPLSAEDLVEYAESSPKSFASTIARLYSSDSRIECASEIGRAHV